MFSEDHIFEVFKHNGLDTEDEMVQKLILSIAELLQELELKAVENKDN